MTPEQLAAQLDGREYRSVPTEEEHLLAVANGLVIVFGASDDFMELCGGIEDEFYCYEGGTAHITADGLYEELNDEDQYGKVEIMEWLRNQQKPRSAITALWDEGEYAWQYKTDIPHAAFDIVKDDEKYCRGIVFRLSDIGKTAP